MRTCKQFLILGKTRTCFGCDKAVAQDKFIYCGPPSIMTDIVALNPLGEASP